jgi:acetyl esterase
VYTPDGLAAPSPGILFVHGGGFVTGDIGTHDGLCARLAVGTRARVISVDYRLAPEHRFPAAADDATAAFRYCVAHAGEFGLDPARVAVAGDSAGGNLSAVISRRTAGDERAPVFAILLYPALDATCSLPSHRIFAERYALTGPMIEWYYGHYFGEQDRRTPDGSPLLGAPTPRVPALVYTAGFDPLRDEGHAYADKLRAAGGRVVYGEFETLIHGFALMTGALSTARAAVEEICDDARRAFDGSFERRASAGAGPAAVETL